MKRERANSDISSLVSGIDSGIDIPTTQIHLPQSKDLVNELFEKEHLSRMQIKEMASTGAISSVEIQRILALNTFMVEEDRKAYLEASSKITLPAHPQEHHAESLPIIETIKSGKSPFATLLDKLLHMLGAFFGLEGDKVHPSNWPKQMH